MFHPEIDRHNVSGTRELIHIHFEKIFAIGENYSLNFEFRHYLRNYFTGGACRNLFREGQVKKK